MNRLRGLMEGQGLAEYAFMLSLVAVVVAFVLVLVGPQIGMIFSNLHEVGFVEIADSGSEDLGAGEPEDEEPVGPPDCYGSLLLPIMVSVMGAAVLSSRLVPKLRDNGLRFGAV